MIELSQLTPDSILRNLPLKDFQIDQNAFGHIIAERFQQEPDLPGVIVKDGLDLVGVISRQRFVERMSRPYGPEIHLKRPIHMLLPFIEVSHLQLPNTCKIDEAVTKALHRQNELAYEPVVVTFKDGSLRILDTRILILAQSQMLSQVNKTVKQQKFELQQYLVQLRQEQCVIQEKNKLLETQQISIRDRNELLEEQRTELTHKSEAINQLNQRFMQISQKLSREGKKAFQSTFDGVDTISQNALRTIEMGEILACQLETVRGTSKLIRRVSQDAKHLARQASILVKQFGSEFEFINQVALNIGKLSDQAIDAGKRMDDTTTSLESRVGELTELAVEGREEAKSLRKKVKETKKALEELEELVREQQPAIAIAHSQGTIATQEMMRRFDQQIETMVSELKLELKKASEDGISPIMLEKIQNRLKTAGRPVLDMSTDRWMK